MNVDLASMRSRCGLAADAPKRRIGAPRRRYGRGPGYRRGVRRNGQIRLENNSALRRLCPTVVELSNLTQFMILIVIVFLIFQGAQITSTIKSKIKRVKVAKHSLNSMAVGPVPASRIQRRKDRGRAVPAPVVKN